MGRRQSVFSLLPIPYSLLPFSIGGMFLWHYPHGHPHWALPSKFGLSEARTFLRFAVLGQIRNHLRLLSPSSSLVAPDAFVVNS